MFILLNLGDSVNTFIDNLIAVTMRLVELPMYVLVIGIAVLCMMLNFIFRRWIFKNISRQKIVLINIILTVLLCAFILDKKLSYLHAEINVLNEKIATGQFSQTPVINKEKIYNLAELKKNFPAIIIYEKPLNEAMDLLTMRRNEPSAMIYIALIDLKHPGIRIQITDSLGKKFLTSEFAKTHNCDVAINGEAGETMALNGELGEWIGNWVVKGKPVMMADTKLRPFLSFNKQNKAQYFKAAIIDTVYTTEKYNTIWGRFDILIDGKIITQEDKPYAQTIMGINAEGTILYLMVVDGKRPDYSIGMTYYDCANMLRSLGASNAMACDRGGSSCMYVKGRGIINRPADSDGYERPVFTHFGVELK